jgi:hypothetical protein
MAAENTTRPRSCKRTKASDHAGLPGEKLAPVIATSRPPSARREERRGDVAQGGAGHAPIDVRDPVERRVHERDAWNDAGVEMIVDLRGVVTGDSDTGEQAVQQPCARVGRLIENERAARELGEDGEQPGSCRRLQHEIGRSDRCGGAGREAQSDRRRELLKRLALFGAARVGGKQAHDLGQHWQHGGGRGCPC